MKLLSIAAKDLFSLRSSTTTTENNILSFHYDQRWLLSSGADVKLLDCFKSLTDQLIFVLFNITGLESSLKGGHKMRNLCIVSIEFLGTSSILSIVVTGVSVTTDFHPSVHFFLMDFSTLDQDKGSLFSELFILISF